jgi:hypothetical protein
MHDGMEITAVARWGARARKRDVPSCENAVSWSCLARHELEIISFYLPQILRLPVLPV